MNAIVIEHVPVNELPPAWRAKLDAALKASASKTLVTVRIEQEQVQSQTADPLEAPVVHDLRSNPLFGLWADREDMADVDGYIRKIRASRFNDDGTRR
jgi:hypothetical protein